MGRSWWIQFWVFLIKFLENVANTLSNAQKEKKRTFLKPIHSQLTHAELTRLNIDHGFLLCIQYIRQVEQNLDIWRCPQIQRAKNVLTIKKKVNREGKKKNASEKTTYNDAAPQRKGVIHHICCPSSHISNLRKMMLIIQWINALIFCFYFPWTNTKNSIIGVIIAELCR